MAGVETFEQNWRNNDPTWYVFADAELAPADFHRVFLGRIDVGTGVVELGEAVAAGEEGLRLIMAIGLGGTGAGSPITLTIDYQDGLSFAVDTTVDVDPLQPEGKEYVYDLPNNIDYIINITPSSLLASGSVDFYAPTSYVEDFERRWPAATQGL